MDSSKNTARADYIRQEDLIDLPAHWQGPLPPPERVGSAQLLQPPSPSYSSTKTKRSGDNDFVSPENVKSRRTAETLHAPALQVTHKQARDDDCTFSLRRPQMEDADGRPTPIHPGGGHNLNKDLPSPPRPDSVANLNPVIVPNSEGVPQMRTPGINPQDTATRESSPSHREVEVQLAQDTRSKELSLQKSTPEASLSRSESVPQDLRRDGSKTPVQQQASLEKDGSSKDTPNMGFSVEEHSRTKTPMQPTFSQDAHGKLGGNHIHSAQNLGDSAQRPQHYTPQNWQASSAPPQAPPEHIYPILGGSQAPYPQLSSQNVAYSQSSTYPAHVSGSQYTGYPLAATEHPTFYSDNTVAQNQPRNNYNPPIFNSEYSPQAHMQSQPSTTGIAQSRPAPESNDQIMHEPGYTPTLHQSFNSVPPYTAQQAPMYHSPPNAQPYRQSQSHTSPQRQPPSTNHMPQEQQLSVSGNSAGPGSGYASMDISRYSQQTQYAASGPAPSYLPTPSAPSWGNAGDVPPSVVVPSSSHPRLQAAEPFAFGTPRAHQAGPSPHEFTGVQHQAQYSNLQQSQQWPTSNSAPPGPHRPSHPPPDSVTAHPATTDRGPTDGHASVEEYSSNASDTSARRVKRRPTRSSKRGPGSQASLSRQGSQPALARQFGAPQAHTNEDNPPQVGALRPGYEAASAWPGAPMPQFGGSLSAKAAGKRPETSAWAQHAQASTSSQHKQAGLLAEPLSASLTPTPTTEQVLPSSSAQLPPAHTARLLECMREMQEHTDSHFKFVRENMLTRNEGATKAEVASLKHDIKGIRATQSVLATQERKRTFENSRRKGGFTQPPTPSGSGSSPTRNRGRREYYSESEEDLPNSTSRSSSSKIKGFSPSLWAAMEPHANALKRGLREHVLKMIGIRDYSALAKKCPPLTEEECEAYAQGHDDAPTVDRKKLRIDFENPWKKFSYNREVSSAILEDFIRAVKSQVYLYVVAPENTLRPDLLEPLLDSHMKTLRKQYRLSKQGVKDKKEAVNKKRENGSRMSRRTSLYESRVMALSKRPALSHILALMDEMNPRNMSEDEQIEPLYPPVYQVRPAAWQSDELRQCFQTVDELYRSDWGGRPLGSRGGNPPRKLLPGPPGTVSHVMAPSGLPRNCYNKEWLKSLKKHEFASLRIKQKTANLSIPDDVDVQPDVSEVGDPEQDEGKGKGKGVERAEDRMRGVQEEKRVEGDDDDEGDEGEDGAANKMRGVEEQKRAEGEGGDDDDEGENGAASKMRGVQEQRIADGEVQDIREEGAARNTGQGGDVDMEYSQQGAGEEGEHAKAQKMRKKTQGQTSSEEEL